MRFHKNLYVSESMTKKKEKVIAKLNKKKYPLNTYVIALIEEGENQLEFYSTLMFRQGSVIDFEDYRNNSSGDSGNSATCDRCPSLCTAEV